MSALIHKLFALVVLITAAVIGCVSFMSFLYFLYAGSPDLIRLNLGESGSLALNGILCLIFFLQHSGMIRRSFRRNLSRFIPPHYQGALYTVASGVVLLLFVAFWQGSGTILLEADGPIRITFRALFFLPILGTCWGMWSLRSIDMFGLDPILKHVRSRPASTGPFIVRGPYRWVRHPLYLFMIVIFWSCPILTTDRLLFNVLWTIWVVAGTVLEERDLTDDFGDAYRDYRTKVPMLLPRGFRPVYPEVATDDIA